MEKKMVDFLQSIAIIMLAVICILQGLTIRNQYKAIKNIQGVISQMTETLGKLALAVTLPKLGANQVMPLGQALEEMKKRKTH